MSVWDIMGAVIGSAFAATMLHGGASLAAKGDGDGAAAFWIGIASLAWPVYCVARLLGAHL